MADAVRGSDRSLTPEARLELAGSLEARQQHGDALLAYYRAIIEAQRQGRWLDAATTPPALLDRVTHAMRYVKAGRRRAFEKVLEPVYARHGREALHRFDDCLAIQVGDRRASFPDPRQRPSVLYFPGLPSAPYFERTALPWLADLERADGCDPRGTAGRDLRLGPGRARLRQRRRPSSSDSRARPARRRGTASTSSATASGAARITPLCPRTSATLERFRSRAFASMRPRSCSRC